MSQSGGFSVTLAVGASLRPARRAMQYSTFVAELRKRKKKNNDNKTTSNQGLHYAICTDKMS